MLSTVMSRVSANMRILDIPIAVLAPLAGTSATKLTNALADVRYLGSDKERDLDVITSRLVRYREALLPLPLPEAPDDLQRLLDSNVSPDEVAHLVSLIFIGSKETAHVG